VYGVYISAGNGYRNNNTNGVATGSAPEGMYMVTEGTHVNDRCCFDYGNAETSNNDTGNGDMDAINFGTDCWFAGGNGSNTANTGRNSAFVTAVLKNNGTSTYAIKDGNDPGGLPADDQTGRHHPGHRRRQQQRLGRFLLRGRDDQRLPLGRHRELGSVEHR
jgi:hypothetical protein